MEEKEPMEDEQTSPVAGTSDGDPEEYEDEVGYNSSDQPIANWDQSVGVEEEDKEDEAVLDQRDGVMESNVLGALQSFLESKAKATGFFEKDEQQNLSIRPFPGMMSFLEAYHPS